MSCGGRTCTSNSPIDFISGESATARPAWLSRIWVKLVEILREERRLLVWTEFEKGRQRRILLGLDDRMLRDIGLTRDEAEREAQKRFWK